MDVVRMTKSVHEKDEMKKRKWKERVREYIGEMGESMEEKQQRDCTEHPLYKERQCIEYREI